MRILPRAAGLLLTVVTALLLSGCIPPGSTVTPEPMPSATPVFASEEEALSAAEAAYREYLAVSDLVAQDGGKDPARFAEVVTQDWLDREIDSAKTLEESGRRQKGNSSFASIELQQLDQNDLARVLVVTYVCFDVGQLTFVNESGADVTPIDRPSFIPLQVTFESKGASNRSLLVAGNEPWTGEDFCSA